MNINNYTKPQQLERYSFLWSELRLVIAAVALFIGGIPPIFYLPLPSGLARLLLVASWIISGVASGYLVYRWSKANQKLFGASDSYDKVAFFVSVVSGINLGLTGLIKTNIGMSIISGKTIFIIVGLIYIVTAAYLYKRWSSSNQKLF